MNYSRTLIIGITLVLLFSRPAESIDHNTEPTFQFLSSDEDTNVLFGDIITITCSIHKLPHSKPMMWLNNSQVFAMNANIFSEDERISITEDIQDDTRTYILTIINSKLNDEGVYECQIPGTSQSQKHTVIVNIAPSVELTEPSTSFLAREVGENVSLTCVAEGKPQPTVQWTRQDSSLPGDVGNIYVGETLELTSLRPDDGGLYECLAYNEWGSAAEVVELHVMYAPSVTLVEEIIHTGPGEQAEIACKFTGKPTPEVQWSRHADEGVKADGANIRISTVTVGGGVVSTLRIQRLTDADLGSYRCMGTNDRGTAIAEAKLSALPHSVSVVSAAEAHYSDQYTLQWQTVSIPSLIEFTLQVNERNESGDFEHGSNIIPAEKHEKNSVLPHHYTIEGLRPNATYVVKLRGRNAYGESDTANFIFRTPEEENVAPPPTTQDKRTTNKITEKYQPPRHLQVSDGNSAQLISSCHSVFIFVLIIGYVLDTIHC